MASSWLMAPCAEAPDMDDQSADANLDDAFEHTLAGLAAEGLPDDTPAGDYSHDALAIAWGVSLEDTARYVDGWGWWLLWLGTHWQRDQRRLAWTLAREFIRPLALGLPEKVATKLRSADTVAAVVNLARSNREIAVDRRPMGPRSVSPRHARRHGGSPHRRSARAQAQRLHHQADGHSARASRYTRADLD